MKETNDLGILGGGQLARMLAQAAQQVGAKPLCLTESADDPAAQICPSVLGSSNDPGTLGDLLSRSRVVIFENEFVDGERLRVAGPTTTFVPVLRAIETLQDKLKQKELMSGLGIPTSPHVRVSGDWAQFWKGREHDWGASGLVLKWATLGYDGKGTWIAPSTNPWGLESRAAAEAFVRAAERKGVAVYAEKKIAFRREIALVGVRGSGGEYRHYPLVVTVQRQGICYQVQGPATALGVSHALESQAAQAVRKVADHLGLVGALAVECFETESGELWVNEWAPRVHNTGHPTMESARASQFENHVRAALGRELGLTSTPPGVGAWVMFNLLGTAATGAASPDGLPWPRGSVLHWYGKRESRPGRKLGHVTRTVGSVAELEDASRELEAVVRRWELGE